MIPPPPDPVKYPMAGKRATPQSNAEARFLASRIRDAERRGYKQKEIADAFGINERTVRKIKRGETSGTRTYNAHVPKKPPAKGASPSIVRVNMRIGTDDDGNAVVRSINARVPAMLNAKGQYVAPTPFDVFRMPNLSGVALAEAYRFQRQYAQSIKATTTPELVSIQPVARRNPKTKLYTVSGRIQ